jgi:hypothetical protein
VTLPEQYYDLETGRFKEELIMRNRPSERGSPSKFPLVTRDAIIVAQRRSSCLFSHEKIKEMYKKLKIEDEIPL